ncbi:MAG: protein kinase [Ideonella sp.]|nr:protein kinase [Ideonella sp.]
MSRSASVLLGLLILSAVSAHLALVLPRLSTKRALVASGAGVVLLLAIAALLTPVGVTAPLMGVAALLAGHAGWELGRRSRRRRGRDPSNPPSRSPRAGAGGGHRRTGAGGRGPSRRPADATAVGRNLPDPAPGGVASTGDEPATAAAATPPVPAPPTAPVDVTAHLSTLPAGIGLPMADLQRTSLGRYRIDRAIGRGSMGAVFLGLDPMLGRQVAIKTMALSQEFAGAELEEAKQRFFREAETAGRLQHRDIVTIYDAGEDQDLAYIAMEFLKGHDLQRHTQAAQLLPVPVVLRIGARVADALAYAHSQGVIHRDVKPANVMLHLPTGAVKVSDFGIARITDASRTRTGMVLGTPSFMSPEHLAGQRVDGRTDLYSLGVMLFQLLTGQLPFQADSMAKLMYRIANDEAPDVRTLRPELPPALAGVLAQALAKQPAARHADGARMAAELRAIDAAGRGPLWAGSTPAAAVPVTATELGAPGPSSVAVAVQPPTPATAGAFDSTVRLVRPPEGGTDPGQRPAAPDPESSG